jgi:flagellar hook-basal body complex protein FliE
MAVLPVGSGINTNLDALMDMYRQQLTGASGTSGTAGLNGLNGLNGLSGVDSTGVLGTSAMDQAAAVRSANFGDMLSNGLQKLENLDMTAQTKAIGAATGDLTDVHDYVIAATEAQTATELTTTLRNKALDSFNEIMRMPL